MSQVFSSIVGFLSRRRERSGAAKRFGAGLGIACIALAAGSASAADVKVQPAAGSGFVVTDQAGATERLRVDEAGGVSVPGLPASPHDYTSGLSMLAPSIPSPPPLVCREANGQLTACNATDVIYSKSARVTAEMTITCQQASPCPFTAQTFTAQSLVAKCPANYAPVFTYCTRPLSPNFHARLNTSSTDLPSGLPSPHDYHEVPTPYSRDSTACIYEGTMDAFVTEHLQNVTYCLDMAVQ